MSSAIDETPARHAEETLKRRLVDLGLLKEAEVAKPMPAPREQHELIVVEGVPVSELILQDRR